MDARKIHLNLDRQAHLRVGPGIAKYITREQAGREQPASCERNPIEER